MEKEPLAKENTQEKRKRMDEESTLKIVDEKKSNLSKLGGGKSLCVAREFCCSLGRRRNNYIIVEHRSAITFLVGEM